MAQFGTLRRGAWATRSRCRRRKSPPYKIDEGKKSGGGERGECAGRSRASFFRLVEVLASHQSAFEPPASVIFVTLTYGRDYDDWRTAKRHLEALRAYMRRHRKVCIQNYARPCNPAARLQRAALAIL